jgi:hypothetical protein
MDRKMTFLIEILLSIFLSGCGIPGQSVIQVETYGDGNVTSTPESAKTASNMFMFNFGDTVTLTAIPRNGWRFAGWYNADAKWVSDENPLTFTADASKGFLAVYFYEK